jgi:hypothetical protein
MADSFNGGADIAPLFQFGHGYAMSDQSEYPQMGVALRAARTLSFEADNTNGLVNPIDEPAGLYLSMIGGCAFSN